jgi:hypothetical protein
MSGQDERSWRDEGRSDEIRVKFAIDVQTIEAAFERVDMREIRAAFERVRAALPGIAEGFCRERLVAQYLIPPVVDRRPEQRMQWHPPTTTEQSRQDWEWIQEVRTSRDIHLEPQIDWPAPGIVSTTQMAEQLRQSMERLGEWFVCSDEEMRFYRNLPEREDLPRVKAAKAATQARSCSNCAYFMRGVNFGEPNICNAFHSPSDSLGTANDCPDWESRLPALPTCPHCDRPIQGQFGGIPTWTANPMTDADAQPVHPECARAYMFGENPDIMPSTDVRDSSYEQRRTD